MCAEPGARPRKMFPPPITTAISTPIRETCAISLTIDSIVARLMPYVSSPIRASPDSLSMIRLYFGAGIDGVVLVSLACLSHHFGREIGGLLFDSFADHEEGIAMNLRLFRRKHLFDRLLVVLDEGLSHERHLTEELVERALHHLRRDLGRLARLFCPCQLDFAFTRHHIAGHFGFRHVCGP